MGHGPPPLVLVALLVPAWSFCAPATPKLASDDSGGGTDGADAAEDAAAPDMLDQRREIDGPLAFSAWPSDGTVVVACGKDSLGKNLSGLAYQPAAGSAGAVLWAVQNDPAKLHRLSWDGRSFVPVTRDAWATGKLLRYPNASGRPDTEGVTQTDRASEEIYVAAERDTDVPDLSRQSILRYELGSSKGVLDATNEWVLTDDQPPAEPNHGLEGIAWIPDTYLVERGFFDEHTQAPYLPGLYPDHGNGIFFVGRDDTGIIYGYLLDHGDGGYVRVAAFPSGQARSVDLAFDRDTGTLWSLCGGACDGRMALLEIDAAPDSSTGGRFIVRAIVPPPKALSGMDNEGFALAPVSECSTERRPVFWADDAASGGYAIRRGSISCGRLY